jgi:hypothetical protein
MINRVGHLQIHASKNGTSIKQLTILHLHDNRAEQSPHGTKFLDLQGPPLKGTNRAASSISISIFILIFVFTELMSTADSIRHVRPL